MRKAEKQAILAVYGEYAKALKWYRNHEGHEQDAHDMQEGLNAILQVIEALQMRDELCKYQIKEGI